MCVCVRVCIRARLNNLINHTCSTSILIEHYNSKSHKMDIKIDRTIWLSDDL